MSKISAAASLQGFVRAERIRRQNEAGSARAARPGCWMPPGQRIRNVDDPRTAINLTADLVLADVADISVTGDG